MTIPREMVRCQPEHIRYLAEHLVPDDRRQFLAFCDMPAYSPAAAAAFINGRAMHNFQFSIMDPETRLPAAAFGGYVTRPKVMQSWMLSSPDGWCHCWRAITKGSRWLMEQVLARGIERVETFVLADRDVTRHWYEKGLRMTLDRVDGRIAVYSRGNSVCA